MWEAIEGEGTLANSVISTILFFPPLINFIRILTVFPIYQYYFNEYIRRRDISVEALRPGPFYALPVLIISYFIGLVIHGITRFMPETSSMVTIEIVFGLIGVLLFLLPLSRFLLSFRRYATL